MPGSIDQVIMRVQALCIGCTLLWTPAVLAADQVLGTLTVKGRSVPLRVAASIQQDPESDDRWLVVLVSDVAVAEADRAPSRLAALAAAGKLRAVRVLWKEGFDAVFAAPYHQALPQSGRRGREHPTINLDRYDDRRFEGYVKSKMLGQEWFFEAHVKAALGRGTAFQLEPEQEIAVAEPAPRDERSRNKLALAKLGYEYSFEMFARAVQDANPEAVQLFLDAGLSPNTSETPDRQPLALAVTGCAYEHEAEAYEMVKALLRAGATVDAGARNGITPLLSAAQYCEGTDIIKALIEAGADVNTRAPGGATPLMFAKVLHRQEAEALLRRAGARD